MFLTIASARLPCCTTLSRLPCSISAISLISARSLLSRLRSGKRLPQFVNEFDRDRREIVDEIERVLDLVRDAGGQLTERGELLGLDQAVLRGAQVLQRLRQFARAGLNAFEQAHVLDRNRRLVGEGRANSICLSVNGRTSERVKLRTPIGTPSRSIGTPSIVR